MRGNQSPKSVPRVNPVITSQKKHAPQNKQVAQFTLAWWKLYLDIYETYHTLFVTLLLNNVEDSDTTMVGNCNAGVISSPLKGYYRKFHMWVINNGMVNVLYISCFEEEEYHNEYAYDKD